jgi:hypothetical protein
VAGSSEQIISGSTSKRALIALKFSGLPARPTLRHPRHRPRNLQPVCPRLKLDEAKREIASWLEERRTIDRQIRQSGAKNPGDDASRIETARDPDSTRRRVARVIGREPVCTGSKDCALARIAFIGGIFGGISLCRLLT